MHRKSLWIVVVAVAGLILASLVAGPAFAQSCAKGACGHDGCVTAAKAAGTYAEPASLEGYSADELKVIKYVADQIIATGNVQFDDEVLAEATGVSVEVIKAMSGDRLESGVMAELRNRNFDFAKLESCAGNCAEFGACSVDKNLAGASGAELEEYTLEKKTDGEEFASWKAPEFTLPTTTGEDVSLADFRGKPVAVVFMATHCNHCADTAPIVAELNKKYKNEDLVILPVMVGARSVKSVKAWAKAMGVDYPILVSEGQELSKAYKARLVPSVFLIDRKGNITKKFVGFKDKKILDEGLNSFNTAMR